MKALRIIGGVAGVMLAASLTACSGGDPLAADTSTASAGSGTDGITIGSANFQESVLIGNIYAEALKAKGVDVKTRFNIGSRETYVPGLKDGSIDLVPEYAGALLQYLDPKTQAKGEDGIKSALAEKLPSQLEALDFSPAQDVDALTVTQATADRYKLTTIEDLAPVASQLVLGGPPEWKTRYDGVVGLKQLYGLDFKGFRSLDAGGPLTLTALQNGQVQAADMFTSDPAIKDNKLVPLQDPKGLFLQQNVVPVINKAKASSTVTDTLDAISAKLTTDDLIAMNKQVADHVDAAKVADDWLARAGLN